MADIQIYESDSDFKSDADDLLNEVVDGDEFDCNSRDARLSPIEKIEKYIVSEHSYNRQMVVRAIVDTLQQVINSRHEVERVFNAVLQLSNDSDDMIRIEMVEHIPVIAEFSHSHHLYSDLDLVSAYLVPVIVQYLSDPNSQARKAGHSSLLQLFSCHLISDDDIENKIVPALIALADPESIDDFRTDAVSLMSRIAPLVGKELTERVFLTRFAQMCNDALFHVRKVCAANFGEICQVVGQENTEICLLPKFYYLCEDGVWGVRNACAECFVQVSTICSSQVRCDDLTPLFVSLLCDQSRWVRLAAFQALGGFISTFADSQITGLYLASNGDVIYTDPCHQSEAKLTDGAEEDGRTNGDGIKCSPSNDNDTRVICDDTRVICDDTIDDTNEDCFDNFHFWRVAPLSVDQSSILAACGDFECKCPDNKSQEPSSSDCKLTETLIEKLVIEGDSCQLDASDSNSTIDDSPVFTQNIVPAELLSHYVSMIEPARAQTVDPEIMRQCAFSFPAVAYTLGRSNWSCLRDLYRTLAKDIQWKVRRTLAFSIHQLAAILGEELTTSDLVPIFDEFIKDLDEVRIGILKHLSNFLKILHAETRRGYLLKLPEFLKIDNCRNWRFRLDLAEQIPLLVDLFSVDEVYQHIRPITLLLSNDHVAEIRQSSLKAISSTLKRFQCDRKMWLEFVEELKCRFGNHEKSLHRRMFLVLCSFICEDESVEIEPFVNHILPAVLARLSDPVPNTRIGLARLLTRHILTNPDLADEQATHHEQLMQAVNALKIDPDRDVRLATMA